MKLFKYDSEKLDFVESRFSYSRLFKRILWILLITILLSLVYYFIIALFVNTREEKKMIREMQALDQEYANMKEKLLILEQSVNDMSDRDQQLYLKIFNTVPLSISEDLEQENFLDYPDAEFNKELVEYVAEHYDIVADKAHYVDGVISAIQSKLNEVNVRKIPSILPVANFSIRQTGASIGRKMHPFYKTLQPHNGIDIVTTVGTDVLAVADGLVVSISQSEKGAGNRITIDHQNGYVTTYSHLKDMRVRKGSRVKRGMKIARVGTSGTAFAPHLHYEVMLNGVYQEPINYFFCDLTPELYLEMIKISMNTGQSLD